MNRDESRDIRAGQLRVGTVCWGMESPLGAASSGPWCWMVEIEIIGLRKQVVNSQGLWQEGQACVREGRGPGGQAGSCPRGVSLESN